MVMVVVWVGVAGTVGRVGVLHCAQEVEGAVGGCGGHPDCWCDHFDVLWLYVQVKGFKKGEGEEGVK